METLSPTPLASRKQNPTHRTAHLAKPALSGSQGIYQTFTEQCRLTFVFPALLPYRKCQPSSIHVLRVTYSIYAHKDLGRNPIQSPNKATSCITSAWE